MVVVLGGCSGKPSGTIDIVTGAETDVFTRAPAPTRIVVESFDKDGKATRIGEAKLPAKTLDLTEQKQATVATLRVTARDDGDVTIAAGSSLLLTLGSIAGRALPIFVQRLGELARMPSPLADGREDPILSTVAGRYVLVVGGTDGSIATKTNLYDLMSLAPLANPPPLAFVPRSIAPVDTGSLLIDDTQAKVFDFSSSELKNAVLPSSGGSLAEVAGGPTVVADDGTAYVVGPARRTGMPTNKVLKIATDGTPSYVSLAAQRLGAGATWVSGHGLVVIGGSATAAGVEVLAAGSTSAVSLGFPPDAGTWVAAPYDGNVVVLAATGTPRSVDVGCASQCASQPFSKDPGATVIELHTADAKGVFALARDADGTTRAFRLAPATATEVKLLVPRKNARSVRLPTGNIAVVGGATTIESFRP
jgi:hypothetical protein